MAAIYDYIVKQGDTEPVFSDTLTYSNGSAVNLTSASVNWVMRALTSPTPVTNASATIVNAVNGQVSYTPTASDTATTGHYMGNWVVTFSGGAQMTFPTDGYLSVIVEENLTSAGGQYLVSVSDAKDYLNIPASDRTHDAKLIRFIDAIRPVVENITGPIIQTTREEWHDGGQYHIRLRRRPSTGFGTTPVMYLQAVSEYRGPIEYTLSIVQDPAHGSIYSCMVDGSGWVTRRTSGGGVIAFPQMPRSVHVWYTAGQAKVPANVYEGCLELIRENFQKTQEGRPRMGSGGEDFDDEIRGGINREFVPPRVYELLQPTSRAPSIA